MFCNNCGAASSGNNKYCSNCGGMLQSDNPNQAPQRPPQPPPSPHYRGPVSGMINNEPGSFANRMHSFGSSGKFLLGVMLFSAGSVFNNLISVNLNTGNMFGWGFANFIGLGFMALPIIALWLIYAASVAPKYPEKTFTALSLIKAHTIIQLVFVGLAVAILVIALVILVIAGAVSDPILIPIAIVIGALSLGIIGLMVWFYYVAILRIVSGVRDGLYYNVLTPIKGVTPLFVMIIIFAAIGILGSLISLWVPGLLNSFMDGFTQELYADLGMVWDTIAMPSIERRIVCVLLGLASHVGSILCVTVLYEFNNSLKRRDDYADSLPPAMGQQW